MKRQTYIPSTGSARPKGNKSKRHKKASAWVAAGVLILCVSIAVLAAIPPPKKQVDVSSSSAIVPVSSAPIQVLTPPPSVALSQPEEGLPLEPPSFSFSAEDLEQMGTLLSTWAAEEKEDEPEYGHNVAVYFKDLETGLEYVYNPEEKFFIASLVKAPHAMYFYTMAENEQLKLEDLIQVTPEMIKSSEENSGKIKEDPDLPRDYSVEELLYYMLRYSDTAAQRILMKQYPVAGYTEFATGLGLRCPEDIRGITSGNITAVDAGVYLGAMYNYMENGQYGAEYKEHLFHTNNTLIRSAYPVAHKYGWDEGAYHDMAVVYAPHPYLLAILTDKSEGTWPENGKFGEIANQLETIMQPKWQALDEYNAAKSGADS